MASWFDSLPPAEAAVPCGGGTHTVRWAAGQLTLPAHPDAEAEMVLGALGGDKPGCVTLTETWARHAADLGVLTAGPRCAADWVIVDHDDVARAARQPARLGAVDLGADSGGARESSRATASRPARFQAPVPALRRHAAARWSGSSCSNSWRSGPDSSSG